jgi:hypothetical protein
MKDYEGRSFDPGVPKNFKCRMAMNKQTLDALLAAFGCQPIPFHRWGTGHVTRAHKAAWGLQVRILCNVLPPSWCLCRDALNLN